MERFVFFNKSLPGLVVVQRMAVEDHRGFLSRIFCGDEFIEAGVNKQIVQINHTYTKMKGTVRGLHFQCPPYAETKLITCLKGIVFDVAVDLRKGSPTFLQWYGEVISAVNRRSLLVPEGFAHGFQTLTKDCELVYLHTAPYRPDSERGVRYNDPAIGIVWPLEIVDLSQRDASYPLLENFEGIEI